jgi:putative tricarboxylic transport membrane protein
MLVILNLPLIGIWIKLLTVPYRWLFPAIVLFCAIGVYSTNNNTFDIWMVAHLRLVGYLFIKLGMRARAAAAGLDPGSDDGREPAPRAAAVARRLERVRHAPLSASLLAAAALLLVIVLLPAVKKKREEAFVED